MLVGDLKLKNEYQKEIISCDGNQKIMKQPRSHKKDKIVFESNSTNNLKVGNTDHLGKRKRLASSISNAESNDQDKEQQMTQQTRLTTLNQNKIQNDYEKSISNEVNEQPIKKRLRSNKKQKNNLSRQYSSKKDLKSMPSSKIATEIKNSDDLTNNSAIISDNQMPTYQTQSSNCFPDIVDAIKTESQHRKSTTKSKTKKKEQKKKAMKEASFNISYDTESKKFNTSNCVAVVLNNSLQSHSKNTVTSFQFPNRNGNETLQSKNISQADAIVSSVKELLESQDSSTVRDEVIEGDGNKAKIGSHSTNKHKEDCLYPVQQHQESPTQHEKNTIVDKCKTFPINNRTTPMTSLDGNKKENNTAISTDCHNFTSNKRFTRSRLKSSMKGIDSKILHDNDLMQNTRITRSCRKVNRFNTTTVANELLDIGRNQTKDSQSDNKGDNNLLKSHDPIDTDLCGNDGKVAEHNNKGIILDGINRSSPIISTDQASKERADEQNLTLSKHSGKPELSDVKSKNMRKRNPRNKHGKVKKSILTTVNADAIDNNNSTVSHGNITSKFENRNALMASQENVNVFTNNGSQKLNMAADTPSSASHKNKTSKRNKFSRNSNADDVVYSGRKKLTYDSNKGESKSPISEKKGFHDCIGDSLADTNILKVKTQNKVSLLVSLAMVIAIVK